MLMDEIRERLHAKAAQHNDPEIAMLADATIRRRRAAVTRKKAKPMTREAATEIRAYKAEHPEKSQWEIGVHFGYTQGRISEVLSGKRT